MNSNTKPGLSGQEGNGTKPRVTARTYQTRHETFTEYHVDAEASHDAERHEAPLRGEIDA